MTVLIKECLPQRAAQEVFYIPFPGEFHVDCVALACQLWLMVSRDRVWLIDLRVPVPSRDLALSRYSAEKMVK